MTILYRSEPPITSLEVEWDYDYEMLRITCALGADSLTHLMEPEDMEVLHEALGSMIVNRCFDTEERR